jgi:hypothetical protein
MMTKAGVSTNVIGVTASLDSWLQNCTLILLNSRAGNSLFLNKENEGDMCVCK